MINYYKKKQLVTVQGIVSPAGWDENGQINAVCIAASDHGLYFVRRQYSELNLLDCIKREVAVTGILSQKDDRLIIDVLQTTFHFPHRNYHHPLETDCEDSGPATNQQKT